MRFSDILASAVASLRRRPLRTMLTSTGVVIGTMSVVVMISLGVGLTKQMDISANSPSVRQITVVSGPPAERGKPAPKMDDSLARTLETFDGVEAVYPVYSVPMTLKIAGVTSQLSLQGIPAEALPAMGYELAWGSFPDAGAGLRLLAGGKAGEIWDSRTGEQKHIDLEDRALFFTPEFFDDAGQVAAPAALADMPAAPGETPDPKGGTTSPPPPRPILAQASGQIAEDPNVWTRTSQMAYADLDAVVKALKKSMPAQKLPNQESINAKPGRNFIYSEFLVMTKDADSALELTKVLRDARYGAESVAEWILERKKTAMLAQAALGGIGAISMVVAAIGIANTMLMSVYERQRDIGVMKVIGASLRDIRRLFLVESASIGFLGGVVGVVLSYILSAVINTVAATQAQNVGSISQIPIWLAVAAVVGATLIAAGSGMIPARRAMNLSPLAAMRAQ